MPYKFNQNFIEKSSALIFLIVISWFPVFLVPFLNDDYQIMEYYFNRDLIDLSKIFLEKGVYYYYWRPVPDFIHGLILLTAGFHPLPFRIVGMIIYSITAVQIFRIFRFTGIQEKTAFISALLFGILPSHALEIAWIADQLEALAACFLLLSFMNYLKAYPENSIAIDQNKPERKYIVFSAFWFIAALMTKELAYAGIFIPVIALIYNNNINRQSLTRVIKDVLSRLTILAAVLVFRIIFVGGTPFESPHFENISIPGMIKNFFIYIPLAFSPPEVLEALYNLANIFMYLGLGLILVVFLILCGRRFKNLSRSRKNTFFAGIAWFIIFIIPALPTLMRWYVFTASIGLILVTAVLIENLLNRKIFFTAFAAIIIFFCYYDFREMLDWRETGIKMETALSSIKKPDKNISCDTLFLWGVPDKYKRVPMMKLGIQQSVECALGKTVNSGIQIISPLRSELIDSESKIILKEKSDSELVFYLSGGRFLEQGGESRSVIKDEKLFYKENGIEMEIKTMNRPGMNPESYAEVRLIKNLKGDHFYYDGEKFKFIKPE